MKKLFKFYLYIFILFIGLFIGLFSGEIYKYFAKIFSNQPLAIEVSDQDSPVNNNHETEEDNRIFHGNSYIQKYGKIFFRREELKNVDIETFEYLTGSYAHDKNHYYFGGKRIYISDGIADRGDYKVEKNFEILPGDYAKDGKYIYYQNYGFIKHNKQKIKIIPGIGKYKNFLQIGNKIFYGNQEQGHIDDETFSHLEYNYFRDKNAIYYGNIVLALNINNYQIIDNYFIKDDRFVYLNGKYFPELDAKSFEQIELPKNHPYFSELYWDNNGLYSFNQYGNNFYKLDPKISKNQIEKCIKNQNLCKSMLGY